MKKTNATKATGSHLDVMPSALAGALFAALTGCVLLASCGGVPSEFADSVERTWAPARDLAERASAKCPEWRSQTLAPSPVDAPSPASIAIGAPFEVDAHVVEVTVECSWPDPRSPGITVGTTTGKLRGVPGGPHVSRVVWSHQDGALRSELRVPSAFDGADGDLVVIAAAGDGLVEAHVALRR